MNFRNKSIDIIHGSHYSRTCISEPVINQIECYVASHYCIAIPTDKNYRNELCTQVLTNIKDKTDAKRDVIIKNLNAN